MDQCPQTKAFFGASGNAVKIQIWVAVPVYVLVAIVRLLDSGSELILFDL
jgi:hypothetical protein